MTDRQTAPNGNAPRVLVVDDESGILDTLRILLRNEGFSVVTALGGRAGLEQLASQAPDIVLTDVRFDLDDHAARHHAAAPMDEDLAEQIARDVEGGAIVEPAR